MTSSITGHHLARLLGKWHPAPGTRRMPDYAALAGAMQALLTDGRLPLGVRLPAERDLAETLRVSRTTVSAAYRLLRESGHLTSRRGAGSWTTLPGGFRMATGGLWAPSDEPDVINLANAAMPPPPQLVAAAEAAAQDLGRYAFDLGYHPYGIPELRELVADGFVRRGLPTSPDQVMITTGVQHAFDLVSRLLAPAGSVLLTEAPSYPNTLAAAAGRGVRVATCALDPGFGWDEDLLLSMVRGCGARLAYLICDFHNPTGQLMPARLRERLAAVAHTVGMDLVVDESFVELPLGEMRLPPPVASFDRHSRVLTVGGMSKPYWGGLRVGWIRAAAPVLARLAAVRVGVDLASPVLDQLVAVRLLAAADQILPARRAHLADQRNALVEAIRTVLPEWRFTVPDGGVALWAELDAPVSTALARSADDCGVRIAPGPRFGVDGTLERYLRLPFTLPVGELTEAVHRLAAARHQLERADRPEPSPVLVA